MDRSTTINLLQYRGNNSRLFTGRPQGVEARKVMGLDDLEKQYDKVIFIVPVGTTSLNPSFFLGLFFPSFKKLGEERFRSKFSFEHEENSNPFKEIINQNISDAIRLARNSLKDNNSLDGFF